jgi:hypothetical protein
MVLFLSEGDQYPCMRRQGGSMKLCKKPGLKAWIAAIAIDGCCRNSTASSLDDSGRTGKYRRVRSSFHSSPAEHCTQPIRLHTRHTRQRGKSIRAAAAALRSIKPAIRRSALSVCSDRCYLVISFIRRSNMDNGREKRRRRGGLLGGMILIVVGMVMLLERNGIIDRQLVSQWWPLLLVLIGGWLIASRLGRNDGAP